LRQVVAELQATAAPHEIQAVFDLRVDVDCDAQRIGQLLSNLLGNAITHGSPHEPIRVHAKADAEHFVLYVTNSGPPIPEAAIGQLFQPFFRGSVRPSKQGLGLGLYIAAEIAKAHGGTLTVTSTTAETRFTLVMRSTSSATEGAATTSS
jgi:sigma-B regulation protein RsbU (phosphoserine phosphatase)